MFNLKKGIIDYQTPPNAKTEKTILESMINREVDSKSL